MFLFVKLKFFQNQSMSMSLVGLFLTITIYSNQLQNVGATCIPGTQTGTTSCSGTKECERDNIFCREKVSCGGSHSCLSANLTNNYVIECTGTYGCMHAVASGDTVNNYGIYCFGSFACQFMVTDGVGKFYFVRGYGGAYRAYLKNGLNYDITGNDGLAGGMIDSGDQEVVTIQLIGDNAANGATVLCREASECYLSCTSTSNCHSANFTCFGTLSASNCNCNGEYCPAINYISTSLNFELKRQLENDIVDDFLEKQQIFIDDLQERQQELLGEYDDEGMAYKKWVDWNEEKFEEFMLEMKPLNNENNNNKNNENNKFTVTGVQSRSINYMRLYTLLIGSVIGIVITLIGQKLINKCNQHKEMQYTPLLN